MSADLFNGNANAFMTEEPAHSSTITQHPSTSLYGRVFALTLSNVPMIADHKNVPLLDGEREAVLHHALERTSKTSLTRILVGDEQACFALELAINHALDVVAAKRFILALRSICKLSPLEDAELRLEAEDALKNRFANDKGLTIRIWPNLVDDLVRHIKLVTAAPAVTLSEAATNRVSVLGIANLGEPVGAKE